MESLKVNNNNNADYSSSSENELNNDIEKKIQKLATNANFFHQQYKVTINILIINR
jgi:hypothetical protein